MKTQTNAMLDLPPETRKAIQVARVRVGSKVPEGVNQKDMVNVI